MKQKNTSSNVFCFEDLYNLVFVECGGNIDTSFPLSFVYFLEDMAQDNDNITLINVEQEMELFSNGFSPNGSSTCNMDNLKHVRVKQYIKKTDGACETVTTDISAYRGKNHKYSKFLANIIVLLSSIEHISYEKVSDILKLFFNIDIDRRRVYDLYAENVKEFIYKNLDEIQNDIRNGNMPFSGIISYDEEFIWIKHQPYVRLTVIDTKFRIIIADVIIPREYFSAEYIKQFLKASLYGLEVDTIITDGYRAYPEIIESLGAKQQRCSFHVMKNLMDDINPIHLSLKRKIKKAKEKIPELEKELKELQEKYKGKVGRIQKTDKKRQKDKARMKELKKEISKKKAEIRKSKKQIKDDKKIIKRISLIFKSKTYETAHNRFNRLYAIKNDLREEIGNFLERLKGYLDSTLNHTINNDIPSTNNLLEGFYKITFPRKIKKIFVTYHGAMNRIALNNIRWMKRNGRYKTLASV